MPTLLALALALQLQAPVVPLAAPVHPPRPPAPPAALPAPSAPPGSTSALDPHPAALLRGDWPAPRSEGRVNWSLKAGSVDDALQKIADGAGWNLVLNTGRAGSRMVVLTLRDEPVEDALRDVLTGNGLVATRRGKTVVVAEEAEVSLPAPPTLSGFDHPSGKRFTGDFDDEEVGDALKQIADAAGLSIVLPRGELSGTVTARFKDVPVEDALRAVLAQGGLTAERQGELVTVQRGAGPLDALLPGLSRGARRAAELAMREADRVAERAERDQERAADTRDRGSGRDREVTGSDLTIAPGESVRNVSVVRGSLHLLSGAEARDVAVVMGGAKLDPGASARQVVAVLGSVSLSGGATAHELVAVGGDVDVGPGAEVEGDVVSVGGRVRIDPSAQVGGSSHSISFPHLPNLLGLGLGRLVDQIASPWVMLVEVIVRFAVLFVLGLVALSVFPRRLEVVEGALVASPLRSVAIGFLGTLGMLVLAVLLTVTIVGILLVPVQVLLVLGGGVLGVTALTYHLGRALPLPASRRTLVLQLAAGTLVFSVVTQIPVIGALAWLATWLLTFGAVLRTRFGQQATDPILPTTAVPPGAGPTA